MKIDGKVRNALLNPDSPCYEIIWEKYDKFMKYDKFLKSSKNIRKSFKKRENCILIHSIQQASTKHENELAPNMKMSVCRMLKRLL